MAVEPLSLGAFCKCFCSSALDERQTKFGVAFDESPEDSPIQEHGFLSYLTTHDQPLRGIPLREGELWFLTSDGECEKVNFSLYVNGFKFASKDNEYTFTLSPFSLVRFCRLQDGAMAATPTIKIFKISVFARGICYYFGVQGQDDREANEERARWVLDISHAMRLVTQSVFPAQKVTCDPPHLTNDHRPPYVQSMSSRRLLAGHLVHYDDEDSLSVLYCELSAPLGHFAKLVAYENASCNTVAFEILVMGSTVCAEKVGINCSCFCVDDHHFTSRTVSERKLWLRALSNVKVKIHNQAPLPTDDDIVHYRDAVREQISSMKATLVRTAGQCDPLLMRDQRKHFQNGSLQSTPRVPEVMSMNSGFSNPLPAKGPMAPTPPCSSPRENGENGHTPNGKQEETKPEKKPEAGWSD